MDGGVVAVRGSDGGDSDELEGVVTIFLREEREHPLYVGEGADGAADAVVVRDEVSAMWEAMGPLVAVTRVRELEGMMASGKVLVEDIVAVSEDTGGVMAWYG